MLAQLGTSRTQKASVCISSHHSALSLSPPSLLGPSLLNSVHSFFQIFTEGVAFHHGLWWAQHTCNLSIQEELEGKPKRSSGTLLKTKKTEAGHRACQPGHRACQPQSLDPPKGKREQFQSPRADTQPLKTMKERPFSKYKA